MTKILPQTTTTDDQIVHPSWCSIADHDVVGSPVHASALIELPGDLAGWLSAQTADGPVVFQLLDGTALDATALGDLDARLTEIAADLS